MLWISTQKQHDVFIQKRAFSCRTLETMNKNIPDTIMIMGEITKRARRRDEQEKLVEGIMNEKCYKIHGNVMNYTKLFQRCWRAFVNMQSILYITNSFFSLRKRWKDMS